MKKPSPVSRGAFALAGGRARASASPEFVRIVPALAGPWTIIPMCREAIHLMVENSQAYSEAYALLNVQKASMTRKTPVLAPICAGMDAAQIATNAGVLQVRLDKRTYVS